MAPQLQNILIMEGNEVISKKMAQHIVHMSSRGCTPDCMSCHFLDVWNREMAIETFEAFLDREFRITDQLVPCGETEIGGIQIATGIVYEIVSIFHSLADLPPSMRARFITTSLHMFYRVEIDTESIFCVLDHWHDSLPRDENGMLIGNPSIRPQLDGHHLHSLPTTPQSTQFGQIAERTSFANPPPLYSPRRIHQGREIRHPRQVNEHATHLPPFFPSNNPPPPPSYDIANPNGSPQPPRYRSASSDLGSPIPFSLTQRAPTHVSPRLNVVPAADMIFADTETISSPSLLSEISTQVDTEAEINSLAHDILVMDLFGSLDPTQSIAPAEDFPPWLTVNFGMQELDDAASVAPLFVSAHNTSPSDFEEEANIADISEDIDDDATIIAPPYYEILDTADSMTDPEISSPVNTIQAARETHSIPTIPSTQSPIPRVRFPNSTFFENHNPNNFLMRLMNNSSIHLPTQTAPRRISPFTVALRTLSQYTSASQPQLPQNEEQILFEIEARLRRIYNVESVSAMNTEQVDDLFERSGNLPWIDCNEEDARLRNFEMLRDAVRRLPISLGEDNWTRSSARIVPGWDLDDGTQDSAVDWSLIGRLRVFGGNEGGNDNNLGRIDGDEVEGETEDEDENEDDDDDDEERIRSMFSWD